MKQKGKPKQNRIEWPVPADAKPHVKNWFRTLGSKRLKGEARERKLDALMNELSQR